VIADRWDWRSVPYGGLEGAYAGLIVTPVHDSFDEEWEPWSRLVQVCRPFSPANLARTLRL
jgi:hypothetical protein